MKLIRQFDDVFDAQDFSDKLRKRGVFTHVSSSKSSQFSRHLTGALKVGVWVVLPEQYDTLNPKVILTQEQIKELEKNGRNSAYQMLNKFIIYAGLICFGFLFYVFFITQ